MKKLLFACLLFSCILLITSCHKTEADNNSTTDVVVQRYGCVENISNSKFQICYDSLTYDSRCPEDAVCGYAGFAMIKITLSENGNLHRFNMLYLAGNSQHYNQFGAVSDTSFNGYKIKLIDVLPHPKNSVPAPASDQYKAVFTVSR